MAQWRHGRAYPARIWNKMMKEICKDETATFTPPPGIISLKICKKTALMPGPYCPAEDIYTEYFIKNQTPTGICFHDRAVIHHPYIDPEPESQIEPEPESGF